MSECCANCRFHHRTGESTISGRQVECRRRAPPPYDFLRFYELELLRDIAWSLRVLAGTDDPKITDDVTTEATEAMSNASWTYVRPEEWCGEWEAAA